MVAEPRVQAAGMALAQLGCSKFAPHAAYSLRLINPYIADIEKKTLENEYFRLVLFTGPHAQLVVMALPRGKKSGSKLTSGRSIPEPHH